MNRNIIGLLVVIIVVGGGWYYLSQPSATTPTPATSTQTSTEASDATPAAGANSSAVTVNYTDQGFSPKDLTVKLGTTVTFVNKTGDRMWVASAVHPTHEGYDGTSESVHCAAGYSGPLPFDECAPGTSFSFTFTKEGTWPFHNHANAAHFGSVTVTQ